MDKQIDRQVNRWMNIQDRQVNRWMNRQIYMVLEQLMLYLPFLYSTGTVNALATILIQAALRVSMDKVARQIDEWMNRKI